jgi:SNF2 family DNA or RNA helicase
MRPQVFNDLLEECVFAGPTRFPGLLKLEQCPEERLLHLQQLPGVWPLVDKKRPADTGWYIPRSLVDMGRLGAGLKDYPEDPTVTTPSGLTLFSHQRRAITFLRAVDKEREGVILAGDMGLAKSVTALQALHLDGYLERPGLVCGPLPSRSVWCGDSSDAYKYFRLGVEYLEGKGNIDPAILERHQWFFCHYDVLKAWQPWIFAYLKPASVIFDESHFLMHKRAGRSAAARELAKCAFIERRYLLTGTPIPNHRLELWNQLAVAQPRQWSSTYFSFGIRHCGGQKKDEREGGHWEYQGETNTQELQARLAGTLLRYTRYDILDELPPMERHTIDAEAIDEDLQAEYDLAQRDVVGYLQSKGKIAREATEVTFGNTKVKLSKNDLKPGAIRLVCLNTLIGILSKMKKSPALNAVIKVMGQHDKLVIFTWRVATAAWLHERLSSIASSMKIARKQVKVYGPVDGKMPQPERRRLAQEFATGGPGIYVATRGAAGISINELSAASAALFVDLYWNTASLTQAESRVHRAGSTAKKVDIYYLVARGTIDDMMMDKLRTKAQSMASLATNDTIGMSLVQDLRPTNATEDGSDLDMLCARLMDMED